MGILDKYIEEFNRLDKPKNFPYKLTCDLSTINRLCGYGVEKYIVEKHLNINLIKDISENFTTYVKLFTIVDEICTDDVVNYEDELDKNLIKTFEKIKFQDTLRNLF